MTVRGCALEPTPLPSAAAEAAAAAAAAAAPQPRTKTPRQNPTRETLSRSRSLAGAGLLTSVCGTHDCMAPEMVRCGHGEAAGCGREIDLWALS